MNPRSLQAFHTFGRLNRLLGPIAPAASDGTPLILSVGEPQNRPPDFVAEELARNAEGWSRYPPSRGTAAYRAAAAAWLDRRYDLPAGMIDPERMILPVPGTREGLFFAAMAAMAAVEGTGRNAILVPNPFYHVYPSAAAISGAEPVFMPATAETGFLPDLAAVGADTLRRSALAFVCSPSNPQGMAADLGRLESLIELARGHGFALAVDECYADIYTGAPPAGALQAAARLGGRLDNLLVFHSLSKRSSAPGLRCGFVVGPPDLIDRLEHLLRVGGAGVPLPVLAAGARLWQDDAHAADNRRRYLDNFIAAERILGPRFGVRRPDGGFFLWLDVGDGERTAVALWRDSGIKVMPGAYMCADDDAGANPGAAYVRAALVYDTDVTESALERLAAAL